MKRSSKTLVGGALVIGSLAPAGVAAAAPRHAPGAAPQATAQSTGDQTRLRLQDCTRDQTRLRLQDGSAKTAVPNSPVPGRSDGHQHMSGPQDGTGPQADRPLDGTGNQWGRAL